MENIEIRKRIETKPTSYLTDVTALGIIKHIFIRIGAICLLFCAFYYFSTLLLESTTKSGSYPSMESIFSVIGIAIALGLVILAICLLLLIEAVFQFVNKKKKILGYVNIVIAAILLLIAAYYLAKF